MTTARERAEWLLCGRLTKTLIEQQLTAHADAAVQERDREWREAVEKVRANYGFGDGSFETGARIAAREILSAMKARTPTTPEPGTDALWRAAVQFIRDQYPADVFTSEPGILARKVCDNICEEVERLRRDLTDGGEG